MSDTLAEPLTPEVLESYDRLRADCGLLLLEDICIIEIRGEDRKGWLQGQATNDLKQLDSGASTSFCICSPTGQLVSICDIWGLGDRFILTCKRSTVAGVMHRFDQMVILEDVEARDVTTEYSLMSVQGPNATAALHGVVGLPTLDAADSMASANPVVVLRSDRSGAGGWDILIPKSDLNTVEALVDRFHTVSAGAREIARIESGIPLAGKDWDSRTLPPELGPAFETRHISYRKGCYTGQEVLMRIHSRGHTNRTWVALQFDKPVKEGSRVTHSQRNDAGLVTSACYSPEFGWIAAAMLRNEAVLDGGAVSAPSVDGFATAEIRDMPFLR